MLFTCWKRVGENEVEDHIGHTKPNILLSESLQKVAWACLRTGLLNLGTINKLRQLSCWLRGCPIPCTVVCVIPGIVSLYGISGPFPVWRPCLWTFPGKKYCTSHVSWSSETVHNTLKFICVVSWVRSLFLNKCHCVSIYCFVYSFTSGRATWTVCCFSLLWIKLSRGGVFVWTQFCFSGGKCPQVLLLICVSSSHLTKRICLIKWLTLVTVSLLNSNHFISVYWQLIMDTIWPFLTVCDVYYQWSPPLSGVVGA
jgi:hypothetical protein